MRVTTFPTADAANTAATDWLCDRLTAPGTRTAMLAAGNTPLELYRRIGERRPDLSRLMLFALDEYVGVPLDEPRNCANLLLGIVTSSWGIPQERVHTVSSLEMNAEASVRQHEQLIAAAGGLDILILGLGQNGHLGFNEPGSDENSMGRVVDLQSISIEANKVWFGGKYAPAKGVTVGMKTILAARSTLVLAFGAHKSAAVQAMVEGPRSSSCPASLLQTSPGTEVFIDEAAASKLRNLKRAH